MKRRRLSDLGAGELGAARASFWDLQPLARLGRAIDSTRRGEAIERRDRAYIVECLYELYRLERERLKRRPPRAALAAHLARELRITRARAASLVVRHPREIGAMVRAIDRARKRPAPRK